MEKQITMSLTEYNRNKKTIEAIFNNKIVVVERDTWIGSTIYSYLGVDEFQEQIIKENSTLKNDSKELKRIQSKWWYKLLK